MSVVNAPVTDELAGHLAEIQAEVELIPEQRRLELAGLAAFVARRERAGEAMNITFICTHNSRRSQIAQVWAQTAASQHGFPGLEAFSGGTEATAFNARAVAALRRVGFEIEQTSRGGNPVYAVRFAVGAKPMSCFSKIYDQPPNPSRGFAAVMTCSNADQACPVVHGAAARFSIRYEDPKVADGSDREDSIYDQRCRQVGREILYLFSTIRTA